MTDPINAEARERLVGRFVRVLSNLLAAVSAKDPTPDLWHAAAEFAPFLEELADVGHPIGRLLIARDAVLELRQQATINLEDARWCGVALAAIRCLLESTSTDRGAERRLAQSRQRFWRMVDRLERPG